MKHLLQLTQRLYLKKLCFRFGYTPLETNLLKIAKNRGSRTVDGLGMLIHQGIPGFEAWFGQKPLVTEELRKILMK